LTKIKDLLLMLHYGCSAVLSADAEEAITQSLGAIIVHRKPRLFTPAVPRIVGLESVTIGQCTTPAKCRMYMTPTHQSPDEKADSRWFAQAATLTRARPVAPAVAHTERSSMCGPKRWIMLSSLWAVLFLNFGFTIYAPAVINVAMAKALGLDRQTLGEMFALFMLMLGLPGPLVGLSVDRIGVRKTLALGSSLIVFGSLLMATIVAGGMGAVLCFGVLVGVGNATGALLPAQTGVARWFVRRRALALSLLYSGATLGGVAAPPLADYLIQKSGTWRTGWWLIAAASAVAACIVLILVRESAQDADLEAATFNPSNGHVNQSFDTRPEFVTRYDWTFRGAIRDRTYWLILCSFVGASAGKTVFLAHGVAHLQDLGHSATFAAWTVGTSTFTGLVGKAIFATLGDRIDPRYLLAGFMACYGAGLSLIVTAHAAWQVSLSATCLGIGFGGGFVCLMTLLSNYYGIRAFPLLAGTMSAIPAALSAIIAIVAGRLFDSGVGYSVVFYVLAIWCVCSSVTLIVMHRPVCPVSPPIHAIPLLDRARDGRNRAG
jgi:MFS family permease